MSLDEARLILKATYFLLSAICLAIAWSPSIGARENLLSEISPRDYCQAEMPGASTQYTKRPQVFKSKMHGYQMIEYKVITEDKYELILHRLVHPSDAATGGPKPGKRKPYILVHGLIGSSASFLRQEDDNYQAPQDIFDYDNNVEDVLAGKRKQHFEYLSEWRSTADNYNSAFEGDVSAKVEHQSFKDRVLRPSSWRKQFGSIAEIHMDHDSLNFGRHFKKVHRQYELPKSAKPYLSRSLAFTLANFGYDVWLVNLRGNKYSRSFNGPQSADRKDSLYWNFDIDTLVRQDLLAAINFVGSTARWSHAMGVVAYSYSNLHLLHLLTKFPKYQERLQPVVMLAPTLFSGSVRDTGFKTLVRSVNLLLPKNGPFPSRLGSSFEDKLLKLFCHLPVAGKLCHLIEMVLYGRSKSLKSLRDDKVTALVKRDMECGQTSLAVLHQIVKNLSNKNILPKYQPYVAARNKLDMGQRFRRSVILIHSEADEISTMNEVQNIRESALKLMTVADYTIKEPGFEHTDFLFSKKNKYLVNGEVARMVSIFDFLEVRRIANQPTNNELMVH